MLALGIFRPDRIASWPLFRMSVLLLVIAVALPGLAAMFAGDIRWCADRGVDPLSGCVPLETRRAGSPGPMRSSALD
jgi:hypothetical protein